jgi:membrane dipeptidase
VLDKIGRGRGKVDGVVMVKYVRPPRQKVIMADGNSFYPAFASSDPKHANVSTIADQCDYIADRIGKHQSVSPTLLMYEC